MRASLVYNMRLFSCKISCGSQSDYSRTETHGGGSRETGGNISTEYTLDMAFQINLEFMQNGKNYFRSNKV